MFLPADKSDEVDLRKTYDAIVVGSGAAGGMAAHVLTSHGMQVLLLEAGQKLNINKELRSMEWPYDHPRRGDMPPDSQQRLDLLFGTIQPGTQIAFPQPERIIVIRRRIIRV